MCTLVALKVLTNQKKYARLPTANNDDKLLDKNSDETRQTQISTNMRTDGH